MLIFSGVAILGIDKSSFKYVFEVRVRAYSLTLTLTPNLAVV